MKHVFFVSSHTSFLTAVGAVEYLNLNHKDIIFFCARNYKNSLFKVAWSYYDISSVFAKYTTHEIWRNRKKRDDYLKCVDQAINEKIGEPFNFYCCHYAHPFFQMVYTHPLCVEGAYIQEGGVPFKDTYVTVVSPAKKIFIWCVNHLYLRTDRCHYPLVWYYPGFLKKQKNVHSFAISDSFFKYLPSENHIIKWPHVKVDIDIKDNSSIFIFDGFVYNTFCEKEYYLEKCERLITEENRLNNYVRFHPAQTEDEKHYILNIFKKLNVNVEVMDSSVPFEWILLSCKKHLNVCGFGSSLLFFAKDFGHNVVCHDRWLEDSPHYRKYKKDCGFMWFSETYSNEICANK